MIAISPRLVKAFVLRDLWINRTRTILTVFGIALGVSVMLAINLANNTALGRFQESIDFVAGKANLDIVSRSGPDLDEDVMRKLQFLWAQRIPFTPIIDQLAVVPGASPDVVQVLGVDVFADPSFRPFALASGKSDSDFAGKGIFNLNSAYVGEKFAEKYGIRKGGKFKLLVNDAERELTAVDVLAYSGPGKAFGGNVLVMDIGPAQELFQMRGRVSRIDLIVPDSQLNEITGEIRAVIPSETEVERPSRRGAQVQKMLAAFQFNLGALSLISLLVGMFLIYNTMSMTVIRKRSEIGILRALGTSRKSIFAIFLIQALILGSTGSLLGLGGGLLFARGAVKAVGTTVQALYVDQPSADILFGVDTLALALVAGVALTIVAALGPIWEAMSVAPAEAARRASYELRISQGSPKLAVFGCILLVFAYGLSLGPPLGGFPVLGYMSAALTIFGVALCMPVIIARVIAGMKNTMQNLFGSEGKLAVLSLGGTLGRTSVTVASLMLGIAMMISLAIMIGSFRETVIVWVKQTLKADLYVEPLSRTVSNRVGRLRPEVVDAIRHLPGVQEVDSFVEFPIVYNGYPASLAAADLDVLARHGQLMFVDREPSQDVFRRLLSIDSGSPKPGCIVSESFALKHKLKKGDAITLPGSKGDFTVYIQGIYYDYASESGYVILTRPLFREHFPDTFSTTLGVYVLPDADLEKVRSAMVNQLGTNTRLNVRTNRELRTEVLRVFDNTFAITYALHAISILVAILGVMNALFALTFEMRRDFAILKYIGASMRQLRKIIFLQAATLGLFGTVSGLLVGFVLSLLLINVINKQSFGWTIQLSIPYPFLIQSFLLIMLFSLLSGVLPARSATRRISAQEARME